MKWYSRRDCFHFSGIPSTVPQTDLEYFGLRLLKEIDINLVSLQIVACHRQGKTEKTILRFLNIKDADAAFLNKRKLKDLDMSDLPPDNIQNNNRITGNAWRNVSDSWKRKLLIHSLCAYYRYSHGLVKKRKQLPFSTSGFLMVPTVWWSYMMHKYLELLMNQIFQIIDIFFIFFYLLFNCLRPTFGHYWGGQPHLPDASQCHSGFNLRVTRSFVARLDL